MKVLIACEFSGIVRDAFKARGHDVVSCDLLATEKPGKHYQGDVFNIINLGWDLMIAHPPCTHLAVSGARWWEEKQKDGRQKAAIDFVISLMDADIPKIALENPVGILSSTYRKPDQYIQPFWFGDSTQKKTGLWLKNLPLLQKTNVVDRGMIYIDPRGKSHGDVHTTLAKKSYSPLMLLPRNEERWKIRSRTFQGIAAAMADQWGSSSSPAPVPPPTVTKKKGSD